METFTIVDSYEDGDAHVLTFACGCELLNAPTYEAFFPCSKAHAEVLDTASRKAA